MVLAVAVAGCGDDDGAATTNQAPTTTASAPGTTDGPLGTTPPDAAETTQGAGADLPLVNGFSAEVEIVTDATHRTVTSNGIPNHEVGEFPNPGNPNSISPQSHEFRVTLDPRVAASITPSGLSEWGIAVNGIPLEPGAAEWWQRDRNSGWQYEALGGGIDLGTDQSNAHVQPTGAYHYHGMPEGLLAVLGVDGSGVVLVGWAADGFPVYARYGYVDPADPGSGVVAMSPGYRLRDGTRPSGPGGAHDGTFVEDYEFVGGDLDECNGRFGVTPEHPEGIYHYYLTDRFPFIPRCFAGTPDSSFARGPRG